MTQKLVSVRKAFRLNKSLVVSLPRGFAAPGDFVAIYQDNGRLILEPIKEVVG